MSEHENTPTGVGGGEDGTVKEETFTPSVADSERSSKDHGGTSGSEDPEIAEILSRSATVFQVPTQTKAVWHEALARRADEMVHRNEKKGTTALAPVPAGRVVQSIAPMEWLGDHMMVYIPESGHWAPSQYLLEQVLTEFVPTLKPTFGLPQAKQILDHAGTLTTSFILKDQPNRAEIDARTWDAEPVITFQNGQLHVPTMTLQPAGPAAHTTWHIPFDWDPTATSAKLDQFLASAVPDAISRRNLLAFIGYSFARYDTSQHQFMYLLGSGRNGKSLLLKLITRALGPYWSNTNLKKLVDSRFAASSLVFSVLNLVGDQDAIYLASTELLKELSGFDAIDVERKFRDSFPYIAKTKFLFAVNELPRTADISYGFFRRPLIVEFPQRFPQDPDYERALLSDDQVVQALLVQAIDAYQAMVAHKGFWIEGKAGELLNRYRSENDLVFAAVDDGLLQADPNPKHHIAPWALPPLVNLYGSERENQKLSQAEILKRLNHAGIIVTKHREPSGHREWYYTGISADPDQAIALIHRSAVTNPDGTETVNVGGKRYFAMALLAAWGITDPHGTIHDPEIAHAFHEEGGSTRL